MTESPKPVAESSAPAQPVLPEYDLLSNLHYFRLCLKTMRLVVKTSGLQSALTLHLEQVERLQNQLIGLRVNQNWQVPAPPCSMIQGAISELVGMLHQGQAGHPRDLSLLSLAARLTARLLELLGAEAVQAKTLQGTAQARTEYAHAVAHARQENQCLHDLYSYLQRQAHLSGGRDREDLTAT
ncbi:hypothetical protein ACFFLM_21455 [Deinococcus oregonensis]|uniref:DUF892 family protein n=1 Tax=Deinococcus oregonensis TaxID=1805970 RepID=A0ABV6B434_9DEIO